ncbi:MAG: zinc ribbon domain-containing protein [Planctomycetota bacterium]|jgi:predicted  nucleic acid-binding Zn-ribbon protein
MSLQEQLLTLHRVNTQVTGLRQRLDSATRFLAAQTAAHGQVKQETDELHGQIRQLEASAANLETESKGIEERIDKLRVDLNASRNDKQYQAILADVKSLQEKRDEIDTQALGHMERAETLRSQHEELAAAVAERWTMVERAQADLDQRRADVGERLQRLEEEREQAARVLPEEIRTIFDRVSEETDGEVMAPMIEISKRHREYACGACNLELPKESFAQLSGTGNVVVQCRACERILYVPSESEVAVGD